VSGGVTRSDGFGSLLRQHRAAAGLSQEELADKCGLSVRAIADMESGRTTRPYRSSIQRLADALALPGAERELLQRASRDGAAASSTPPGQAGSGHVAGATQAPDVIPRQLPAAVPHFTGRAAEIKALTSLLDTAVEVDRTVKIPAIAGTAGVGKTALAVYWAHQVADRFPDGQLYVNLRGFDLSDEPVPPAEAIRGFLDALGVPPAQIPTTAQAQAGLFRSLLAGRSVLIVADNARDAAQVRPLLPGNPACLVVVTSRSQLAGLVAADGASPLVLDVLTTADAVELLSRRLGSARLVKEPQAVKELIGLCARLPLALAIVAARAAAIPALPLSELASDLRAAVGRLDALDTGEAATSLRTVFWWSYRLLSDPAARMFRLLGVHPGPDIAAAAATSLIGLPAGQSRALLRELARCHLVTERSAGRFVFHDMLRVYAAEQASRQDGDAERRAAIHRVLDHYLHTAHAAARVSPHFDAVALASPQPGVIAEDVAGYEQAMAWFEAEHRVLLRVIAQAVSAGFDAHACLLPSAFTVFLDRQGYWDDYATIQQTALAASLRMADVGGQARAHQGLGQASTLLGSFSAAHAHFRHALDLCRQLQDRQGQARAHIGVAFVFDRQGRYGESLAQCAQALDLYQALGDRARQAMTVNNIGWCHSQLGNYREALTWCHQAIALHEELGDAHGQAAMSTWDSLGYAYYQLGEYAEAASCLSKAVDLFAEFGDRHGQAEALAHLGDAQLAVGQPEIARGAWTQALAILDDLHHPDAEQLRARL
jgi:tetratricopeptide (TPR) repeat protein/transcriptional regulator with XRE-family HTH domain